MTLLLLLAAAAAAAQPFQVTPSQARQGTVLQVRAHRDATSARMHGRTVPLFPQADGTVLGLMPVPVLEKPGVYALEWLSPGGSVLHTQKLTVLDAKYPRQNIQVTPSISSIQPSPGEREAVNAFKAIVSETRHWQEPLAHPVPGCMTSLFGVQRYHNGKPTGNFHGGIDQRSAAGRPIHTVAAGVVRLTGMFNLHGGTVGVDHGQGLSSMYLHMSKLAVADGAAVKKGEVIGYVGSTGRSTAPHLHWSLYAHGAPVNPNQWMAFSPCASGAKKPSRKKAR